MANTTIHRGQVIDTSQLESSGRVRVAVPGGASMWAPVCYTCACAWGVQSGATVIVAYEGGDASRPVVLGQIG